MCFSIPLQVVSVVGRKVVLENGTAIDVQHDSVTVGDYVRLNGSVIVDILTASEGHSIRSLLSELQIAYE